MGSSIVPLKTRRAEGGRCTLNLSRLKHPPIDVVWKFGEWRVQAQMSSSSLDHGSKLRVIYATILERTEVPIWTYNVRYNGNNVQNEQKYQFLLMASLVIPGFEPHLPFAPADVAVSRRTGAPPVGRGDRGMRIFAGDSRVLVGART
ncbi:hypothetical protein TNCV_3077441 [Trichonephila clavipes]|nr:hypothetical protein TNCV_3077441 [Trichonephila clavipes]